MEDTKAECNKLHVQRSKKQEESTKLTILYHVYYIICARFIALVCSVARALVKVQQRSTSLHAFQGCSVRRLPLITLHVLLLRTRAGRQFYPQ